MHEAVPIRGTPKAVMIPDTKPFFAYAPCLLPLSDLFSCLSYYKTDVDSTLFFRYKKFSYA